MYVRIHWNFWGFYSFPICSQFTPEYINLFKDSGVPPKRYIARMKVTPNAAIQPGTPLTAMHFRVGDFVEVVARRCTLVFVFC